MTDLSIRNTWLDRYDGKSRSQAKTALNAFDQFIKANFFDNEDNFLIKCRVGNEENKYILLDDLVQYWAKTNKSPVTIRNYFTFIRAYLRRHGIKTDDGDIKDYIKFPKQLDENRSPLTKELIIKILSVCDPIHKAFYLFLACTGMRIGEALQSQINWLDLSLYEKYNLVLINIPANVTKGKSERFTFITDQAYQTLKPYIEKKIIPSSLLFDFSYGSIEEYIKSIRIKLDLLETYSTGIHKIRNHAFRSFADTILTNKTNEKFCKFLLGHKDRYHYYRPSHEEAAQLYKLAEPYLIVS